LREDFAWFAVWFLAGVICGLAPSWYKEWQWQKALLIDFDTIERTVDDEDRDGDGACLQCGTYCCCKHSECGACYKCVM
jgi:hypothetical protein